MSDKGIIHPKFMEKKVQGGDNSDSPFRHSDSDSSVLERDANKNKP
jgi:hypothetical protein